MLGVGSALAPSARTMVTSEGSDLPIGDLHAIHQLNDWGGEALVTEMTAVFLAEAPKQVLAIREGFAAADADETKRAAHSLSSSSAQLGAPRLRAICQQIEMLAGRRALAALPELVAALDSEFASFVTWLNRATKNMPAPTMEQSG